MDGGLHLQGGRGCEVFVATSELSFSGLGTALERLPAYVIREIPRREDGDPEAGRAGQAAERGRAQRMSALVAAYHSGISTGQACPVAFGWVRGSAGGPIRVIAAGDALVGGVDERSAEVFLSLPAGARARVLGDGELAALAGGLGRWREIAGISDGLLTADGKGHDGDARGARAGGLSLDEGLLGSWNGAFGWLVIAEPLRIGGTGGAGRGGGAAGTARRGVGRPVP